MPTRRALLFTGLCTPALAQPALAQHPLAQHPLAQHHWPKRQPIRLIAGFPAGGLADAIGRLVAGPLGEALGTAVVVENRAGASGTIAADAVAKAAPDGLTLALSHAIPFGFAPGVLPSVPYDPVADFTHLGLLAEAPTVVVVRGNSPFATLSALIEASRRTPIRYGSSGVGSAEHILGAVVASEARTTGLDHIPYRGTAPALQDLLGGQIEAMNAPITTLVGQLRDGSLRALATSTPRRLRAFPDVPTLAELGFGAATFTQWIGLSGPRGLPAPAAERLVAAIAPILARAEVRARLAEFASEPREPVPTGPEFARFVAAFRDEWVAKARALNIVAS